MRYIKFSGGTDYCGTEFEDIQAFEDSVTDSELDEQAEEMARENGESYSYLHTGWEDEFEDEDDEEAYFAGCYCNWEEVSYEEYAQYMRDNGREP